VKFGVECYIYIYIYIYIYMYIYNTSIYTRMFRADVVSRTIDKQVF